MHLPSRGLPDHASWKRQSYPSEDRYGHGCRSKSKKQRSVRLFGFYKHWGHASPADLNRRNLSAQSNPPWGKRGRLELSHFAQTYARLPPSRLPERQRHRASLTSSLHALPAHTRRRRCQPRSMAESHCRTRSVKFNRNIYLLTLGKLYRMNAHSLYAAVRRDGRSRYEASERTTPIRPAGGDSRSG